MEAITEMIIPGTYIEVRAEGLIGVTGIATGNLGMVGTANMGPVGTAEILSSFSDATAAFGAADVWAGGTSNELTLVRALQQAFAGGATTVYAVRAAGGTPAKGSRALVKGSDTVATLTAKSPGTWAGDVTVQVNAASANAFVAPRNVPVDANGATADLLAHVVASPRNAVKVTRGGTGQTSRLALVPEATGTPTAGTAFVNPTTGALTFAAGDAPAAGDTVSATYAVAQSAARDIVIQWSNLKQTYTVADGTDIATQVAASTLVDVEPIATAQAANLPDIMPNPLPLAGGSNGEGATAADYATALAALDAADVNLVVLAGQNFSNAGATLLAHVENAENNGFDRIAVVGADADDVPTVQANADSVSDDRIVLVAPGIVATDLASGSSVNLPPAYSAAVVAGLIASLAVQVSPTNQVLPVSNLTTYYNDGQLKALLETQVLPLEQKSGFRVVKGITTDTGPFRQISVRRIVDYAKAGTRIGTLPYIGTLNNARVRGAMQATLNGFLSQMVLDEALTQFTVTVTATRDQEINGVALVTMLLQPTFSIDYIQVIMNLS
jgi:tail sheath protein